MSNHSRRYVLDPLYGRIDFPTYVWDVFNAPELQRLREVRMCNINSLCLTGGANINRFEHALGTAHLALRWLRANPFGISPEEARLFVLAALLHDVGSAAFGHSVEYVLERQGYRHESFYNIVMGFGSTTEAPSFSYQDAALQGILLGMPRQLPFYFDDAELTQISDLIEGKGPLGPLINGTIDLDNIDNVFRLAYHIGIYEKDASPICLAENVTVDGDDLFVSGIAESALRKWYHTRRQLYTFLLLNPDEFSAKAMLQEAIELARRASTVSFQWTDVDFELLVKLRQATADTKAIVDRLWVGDLYGCYGIFVLKNGVGYDLIQQEKTRREIELRLQALFRRTGLLEYRQAMVRLHGILDRNKTRRQIRARLGPDGTWLTIGEPTDRHLLGVFFKNRELSMGALFRSAVAAANMKAEVIDLIGEALGARDIVDLNLFGEACP